MSAKRQKRYRIRRKLNKIYEASAAWRIIHSLDAEEEDKVIRESIEAFATYGDDPAHAEKLFIDFLIGFTAVAAVKHAIGNRK